MKLFIFTLIATMAVMAVEAHPMLFPAERLGEVEEIGAVHLAKLVRRAHTEPEVLAHELATSPLAARIPIGVFGKSGSKGAPTADSLPIVAAHGMGDSCFNPGMQQLTQAAGQHMGVYSVCVPTGDNWLNDTIAGFLVTMDHNVDIFASLIKADAKLAGGFDAMGFSQGNSVIRGYIQRYNDPPVRNYLAVHGTVMGVAGFPQCNPESGPLSGICQALDEVLGDLAYNGLVQDILFQANYFRDPKMYTSTAYQTYSQLAQWNNENPSNQNPTYAKNFDSLRQWIMIKADGDTMVWPNAGEWWGDFVAGQYTNMESMNATRVYDLFGLKTADVDHKIAFNQTAGEHLQFTEEQLFWWLDHHFHA